MLSGCLEDDAFDDVGDVFALVDGSFNYFEDFFPFDDLHGVFFFVEELGNEGAAETVAFIFVAIDLNAVLEGFLRRLEGTDGGFNHDGGRDEDFDEVDGTSPDRIDAVEDEAAGGSVDEVNDIVELAAKLVDIFAVERCDKSLVQLGEDGMRDFIAFMLDGFDDLDLLGHARVVGKHFEQGFRPFVNVDRLLGEKVEETLFARQKPLQKSWHGM